MSTLYVLQLENGKYYVGKTDDLSRRYSDHKSGKGSEWTKIHKPVKILETRQIKTDHDENNLTKDLMKKYGTDNVRGGSYSQVNLGGNTYEFLERETRGNNDTCFKCGNSGHFVKDCDQESEEESEEDEVWITNCCGKEFKSNIRAVSHERRCTEKTSNACYRCGRTGHYSNQCYAQTHIHTKQTLDSDDDVSNDEVELDCESEQDDYMGSDDE